MSAAKDRHVAELVSEAIHEIRAEQRERQLRIEALAASMRVQARRLVSLHDRIKGAR